ncbi:MAG: CHASE2 domain-containing protein [Leptolyngbyaceae cyanobacterium MO_188.B28]|nr:CHASE2 domain-containing protein [Leptolyngbyaceae cyanobacterium MO_188.B28]
MGKWVILELEGDFNVTGFRASLEIRDDHEFQALKVKGFLPPAPEIAAHLHHHWQEVYRPLGVPLRIKGQKIIHKGSINQRLTDCQWSAQILCEQFRTWLNAESFQLIDRRLREELNRNDAIQFLIRTQDMALQKLPWHEWDFFERYSNAEAALSTPEYELAQVKAQESDCHPVRILAILGDSRGINVEADRHVLAQLPQAQVTFLVEPDRSQLNDRLWESQWDILFFAGHSETHQGQGRIYINQTDSLTLPELRFGLRKAIAQGLQLAIFNACDGLGLASALHQLHIPLMIVMREPVADQVAAAFLTYFLNAFASGESFYLAARQARERLQGLEHQFPCASWLPVIYQNPLVTPPDWLSLQGGTAHPPLLAGSTPPILAPAEPVRASSKQRFPGFQALWISVLVTLVILIVRHLGVLQPFELTAYDRLMRSRPAEAIDPRILVVEVTQADLNEMGGYPLSDAALAQTVEVLQSFEPVAIGLDMHRYRPRGEGRQALIAQFNQHSNLFTVCAFDQVDQDYGPPPELSDDQIMSQVGFSNFALDKPFPIRSPNRNPATPNAQEDCLIRRHLLSYTPDLASTHSACSTPYSLSFQLAYQFLSQSGVEPLTVTEQEQWQFGTVVFSPLTNRFGGYQRLNGLSAQLMLNYRAAPPGQRVSLQQVLTGQIAAEQVRDHLVLVGYTAPVARDAVDTPYGEMPGVWVHSHMVSQLLSAVLDQRPQIGVLPQWRGLQWGDGVWLMAWSLIAGGISSGLNARKTKLRRSAWLLLSLAFAALSWGLFHLCVIALTQGLWLPLIPTLLGVLLTGGWVVIGGVSRERY